MDVDEMSMLGEESFRFTGDSIEIISPPFSSLATVAGVDPRLSGKNKEGTVGENTRVEDLDRLKQGEEIKMIEGRLATSTLERDDALIKCDKERLELKEMRYNEVRRGMELELERCAEYRGWLDGLRALIAERGGMK